MKFNFKKIAPVLCGAILLGSTIGVAGAFATEAYPASFANSDSVVVIGDGATADQGSANSIAANIASKMSTGSITSNIVISGGKKEDLKLHTALNATFGSTLDDSDVAGLQDSVLSLDMNNVEDDYDVHDELRINTGMLETGLTYSNADEDWKDNVFLPLAKNSIGYYYVFDDNLNTGNYVSNASSEDPITIEFLGQSLEISGASASGMTVTTGQEEFMNVDDTVVVDGKTVKLLNVGTNDNIVVTVDGVQKTISGTATCNGLKIKVDETFYADAKIERSATLIIGDDATKTYNDGDAYIGQDEDDPDWVWDLANLNTANPTIGITYDQIKDDIKDYPPMMGENETLSLPNNYIAIKIDSFTEKDYQMYEIETSTEEVYNATGGSGTPYDSSISLIHINGAGDDDSFEVSGGDDTDNVYLGGDNSGSINVFWKDPDDGKIKYTGTTFLAAAAGDTGIDISFKDTNIPILVGLDASGANGNITLQTNIGEDITIAFKQDANGDIKYLGGGDGDTSTTGDLKYGSRDISSWEEDTMTEGGIIITDPKSHLSGDTFEFNINGDESDFKVNVVIAGPGATTETTASNSTGLVPVMKASELGSLKATKNLVVIGGSAINSIAAELLGLPFPTYGTSDAWKNATNVSENMAIIKLFSGTESLGTGKIALLVAGYEALDTQIAADYLTKVGSVNKMLNTTTTNPVVLASI